jgi:spore photoproduct lyase
MCNSIIGNSMTIVEKSIRKSLEIKYSGRSTDFLTPTIIFGCGFQCLYCYCKRHKVDGVNIASNLGDILTEVNNHAYFTIVDKPNQTHPEYTTYDLGCNSDMALHAKHYDWVRTFEFFKNHPKAMGSFATKYVNTKFLDYNPEGKIRIRFSLMPQSYSDLLEPNTSKIMKD